MKKYPRRSFQADIDGRVFTIKEMSVSYLDSIVHDEDETIDAAILDTMGELALQDLECFGQATKANIYAEIIRFTFPENTITKEDINAIASSFSMSFKEANALPLTTKETLKATLLSRLPRNKVAEKKPLQR